jgi:hypothetical protein
LQERAPFDRIKQRFGPPMPFEIRRGTVVPSRTPGGG